jgi:hypothetical protein
VTSKNILLILALMALSYGSFAFDHQHTKWNALLAKNLTVNGHQSLFNYANVAKDSSQLQEYTKLLSEVTKDEFDAFNQDQQLAFLINAYNAFTVQLIVKNYPVKSIKDLGSIFRSPWKKKFFKLFGNKTHLDGIEHDMIRKWYKEPRIHFAVVCASLGCPPLATKAFTASNLDGLLEQQAINFITDPHENAIKGKRLYLSKIFKWYGDDFESKTSDFKKFVALRITKDTIIRQKIVNGDLPIYWNDYNWELNE